MPIRKWQWWVVSHDRPRRKLCWCWEMMRFVDRCRDMCQGMLETLVCSFLRGQLWSPFKRCTNVGKLPSRWQSSWIVRLLEKGREYNGEFWGGVTENSSWNQIWSTGFIDLNFQEMLLNAFRREWYIRHTLIRRGGLPALIQRLSDWSARENNRNFFSWKNRHICISISHHDGTLFHCLVQPSHFLDPLPLFIILCGYLQCHQNRCCVAWCMR